jgi:hypothetical protein
MGPTGFHPRLTVLQAGPHERSSLGEHIGRLLRARSDNGQNKQAGAAGEPESVLGPDDLDTIAQDVADRRIDNHGRRGDELESTLRSARETKSAAASRREEAATRGRRLSVHLDDCAELLADSDGLHETLEAAGRELDARQMDHQAAQDQLAAALDQRDAATRAIKDARAQLAELESSNVDESTVRRRLEVAGRDLREAEAVQTEALRAYPELEARAYERQATREQIASERAELADRISAPLYDSEPLQSALEAYDDQADISTPDPVAQGLATEWLDVLADLDGIEGSLPPVPSEADLAQAEHHLGEIEGIVAELEATSRHSRLDPAARADIEAAHESVLAAEEALDQSGGHPDIEHHLEAARADEQQLLAHYGYVTYLDLVMAEPEPAQTRSELMEALRARREAEDALASLWAATEPPEDVATLQARRERIYREATELLGCDPGDNLVELLEAQPVVPARCTRNLADALAAYGVYPDGVNLRDAAIDLLLGIDREVASRDELLQEVERLDAELLALDEEEGNDAGEEQQLMQSAQAAAADVDAFTAEINELERTLVELTTHDERRIQRVAAAEQLRGQIAAVSEALDRSDDEYHAQVAETEAAVNAAEEDMEQAMASMSETSRKLRTIVDALPAALRPKPTDDPLVELPRLHEALASEAERAQAAIAGANREHDRARDLIEETQTELDALVSQTPADEVLMEDFRAAVTELVGSGTTPAVLDDPFNLLDPAERVDLLGVLADAAAHRQVVLLTDDPDTLGWAISLPAEIGAVTGLPVLPVTQDHALTESDHDQPGAGPATPASARRPLKAR